MQHGRLTSQPNREVAQFDRNRWSEPGIEDHLRANPLSAIFPPARLAKFAQVCATSSYPKGRTLFEEGEVASGAYFVVEGAARVFSASSKGKTLLLTIAGPGSILGLPTAILGWRHQTSAEMISLGKIGILRREELLRFLRENNGTAYQVLEHLSEDCYRALSGAKTIGLAENAGEKVARLLLQICSIRTGSGYRAPAPCHLRHEDIAQMLGIARETASRLLSTLKRRQIVECRNSSISVRDRGALERLAGVTDACVEQASRLPRYVARARGAAV